MTLPFVSLAMGEGHIVQVHARLRCLLSLLDAALPVSGRR